MWGSIVFTRVFFDNFGLLRPNRSSLAINFLNISSNQLLNQYVKVNAHFKIQYYLFILIFKNKHPLILWIIDSNILGENILILGECKSNKW